MISPIASYNRQTSFGMAFRKPNETVIQHIKRSVEIMKPEERKMFTERMAAIVESQKNNPVPIEQGISGGYNNSYMVKIGNNSYYMENTNKLYESPNSILATMQKGAEMADNQNNINQTMRSIEQLFSK